MKLEPEIEELIWELAENPDDIESHNEFVRRYPQHREALAERVAMVKELRQSKPEEAPEEIFVPSPGKPRVEPNRFAIAAATTIFTACLGFAIFGAVQLYKAKQNDRLVFVESSAGADAAVSAPATEDAASSEMADMAAPPSAAPADRFKQQVNINASSAPLSTVLDMVARQAGVRIDSGNNFPNPTVNANYTNASALSVLQDLGRNFGFQVIVQTSSDALLIANSAYDPNAVRRTSSGGQPIPGGGTTGVPPSVQPSETDPAYRAGDPFAIDQGATGNPTLPEPGMSGPIRP